MPILLFVGGELELRIFLFRIYFLFHNSNLKILIIHLKAFRCTVALPLVVRMCWPEAGLVIIYLRFATLHANRSFFHRLVFVLSTANAATTAEEDGG
jgi:hypothetical protein